MFSLPSVLSTASVFYWGYTEVMSNNSELLYIYRMFIVAIYTVLFFRKLNTVWYVGKYAEIVLFRIR